MGEAEASTGLSDFGDRDEFRVGLRVLLAALDESAAPEELQSMLQASWRASLETRLRLIELRRRRPEISKEPIEGPVAVIGLPRTGTTALVDLLAQDPAARAPLQWETANLFPPPRREGWDDDPRISALQEMFEVASETNPLVALGLHTFGATLPDECNSFLTLDFWSPNLTAATPLPAYSEWLRLGRLQHPYATHHMVLQHLQAHGPAGRWTLKSPFHTFAVSELLEEYPEAMLVQTHRDPVALLPSMAGMYSTIRGQGPGDPGRHETAMELLALWGTGLQRCLAARRDPDVDARVFDVSHRSMAEDPMGTVRAVYERFQLPLSDEAARRMTAWATNPAQHMSSVKFSLDEFGVSEDQVEEAFGGYRERFGDHF